MSTSKESRPETPVAGDAPFRLHYAVIAPLIMGLGVGDGKNMACLMEQAATIDALRKGLTLDKATDEMDCACRMLRRIAISGNDLDWWESDAERTEFLRPFIPLLLDSRASVATTLRRCARWSDAVIRELTPMRLEWIAAHTKNEKVKTEALKNAGALRLLAAVTDKASALKAREALSEQKSIADAIAIAIAYADAIAYAYDDAIAIAIAIAYAYAYDDAIADANAKKQRRKYRDLYLSVFKEIASMRD
jgi:hypothetical protein